MTAHSLYPNTFQHQNAYIDVLAYFLTGNEEKVLNRVVREVMGWEEHRQTLTATISISTLVDGKVSTKTGERLSYGCGLSASTVRTIMHKLTEFRIVERVGEPTQDGQAYKLQLDLDRIDWDAIEERKANKDQRALEQMRAARANNPLLLNSTPPVEQEAPPSVEQEAPPPVQQEPKNPHETQSKPKKIVVDDDARMRVESRPTTDTTDPILAQVVALYEQEIGGYLTAMIYDELTDLVINECQNLERWRAAFQASIGARNRWKYARAIILHPERKPPTEVTTRDKQSSANRRSGRRSAAQARFRMPTQEEMDRANREAEERLRELERNDGTIS